MSLSSRGHQANGSPPPEGAMSGTSQSSKDVAGHVGLLPSRGPKDPTDGRTPLLAVS